MKKYTYIYKDKSLKYGYEHTCTIEEYGITEEDAKNKAKDSIKQAKNSKDYPFLSFVEEKCEDIHYKKVYWFLLNDGEVGVNSYRNEFGDNECGDYISTWSKCEYDTLEEALVAKAEYGCNNRTTPVSEGWGLEDND